MIVFFPVGGYSYSMQKKGEFPRPRVPNLTSPELRKELASVRGKYIIIYRIRRMCWLFSILKRRKYYIYGKVNILS